MLKPINEYLVGPGSEWTRMPDIFTLSKPDEEKYAAAFMRLDGIQLITSARNFEGVDILHVSLSPVYSIRKDITHEMLQEHVAILTPAILREFFGERQFTRQPDDPRPGRQDSKHYFSSLNISKT